MSMDRFGTLYIERGAPNEESLRARRRCAAEFRRLAFALPGGSKEMVRTIETMLERECGTYNEYKGNAWSVAGWLDKCEMRDFLDAITFIYRIFRLSTATIAKQPYANSWLEFVERVMREENLCYTIEPSTGVVRYRIDSEYEANAAAIISALDSPKFVAARDAFQRARDDLARIPPDSLDATRSLFEAAESIFKVVTNSKAALDEGEVKKALSAFVDKKMSRNDAVARRCGAILCWLCGLGECLPSLSARPQ